MGRKALVCQIITGKALPGSQVSLLRLQIYWSGYLLPWRKTPQPSAAETTLRPWGTYFESTQSGLNWSLIYCLQVTDETQSLKEQLRTGKHPPPNPRQLFFVSLCLGLFFSVHVDLGSYSVSNMRCAYHTSSCICLLCLQLVALLWEVVTIVGGGT